MSDPNRGGDDVTPERPIPIPNSYAHKILSEEFARLQVWNRSVLEDFNPQYGLPEVDIELKTDFREYEREDPDLAEEKRNEMLYKAGLSDLGIERDDPRVIISVTYSDGKTDLLWMTQRDDGTFVNVWTRRKKTAHHNKLKHVLLLSHSRTEEIRKILQDHIDERQVDQDLLDELELYGEDEGLSKLSLKDKQGLLAQLYDIRDWPEVALDSGEELR